MSKKEENKRNKKTLKMAILLAVFLLMLLFLLHQCSNKNNVREEENHNKVTSYIEINNDSSNNDSRNVNGNNEVYWNKNNLTITKNNKTENIEENILGNNTMNIETSKNVNDEIDKLAPQIVEIRYSEKNATSGIIKVEIIATEELQGLEGWQLSEDKKKLSKEYETNTNESILVKDLAGNVTELIVQITNIDKKEPNIEVEYERIKQDIVKVIITSDEPIKLTDECIRINDNQICKVYENNINEEISIGDLVGNIAVADININNIDKSIAHTHASACYSGHNHIVEQCVYHTHNNNCYENRTTQIDCTHTSDELTKRLVVSTVSHNCDHGDGTLYEYKTIWEYTCEGNTYLSRYSTSRFCCPQTNDTVVTSTCSCSSTKILYSSANNGLTHKKNKTTRVFTCTKQEGYQCGYTNDSNNLCSTIAVDIMPIIEEQKVNKGEKYDNRVLITYLDGHTSIVKIDNCKEENDEIVLTYHGLYGNANTIQDVDVRVKILK